MSSEAVSWEGPPGFRRRSTSNRAILVVAAIQGIDPIYLRALASESESVCVAIPTSMKTFPGCPHPDSVLPRPPRVSRARGVPTFKPTRRHAGSTWCVHHGTATTQGDLAEGTAEVHVLLLEGCGARGVLAGAFVAGLAKRLLVERGLSRPPPARRRDGALPLPSRLGGNEAGTGLLWEC